MRQQAGSPANAVRFAWALLLVIMVLSVLKGVRFPNLWSYTHFLFSYEAGFSKRSLVGALVDWTGLDVLKTYQFFVVFSFSVFFASLALLLRRAGKLGISGRPDLFMGLALFLSSTALVFLSHTVGYVDHLGLLVFLIALNLRGYAARATVLLVGGVFCLLAHEAFFLVFAPAAVVMLLKDARGQVRRLIALAGISVVFAGLTFLLSQSLLSQTAAAEAFAQTQGATAIPLREDAFGVLHRSGADNLSIMREYWSRPDKWLEFLVGIPTVLPSLVMILYLAIKTMTAARHPRWLVVLAVLAALSPLLLHLFGKDIHRFNNLALLTSFLIMLVFAADMPVDRRPLLETFSDGWAPYAVVILVPLNLASAPLLFDGYEVKLFPFVPHLEYLQSVLLGGEAWLRVPER